MGIDLQKIGLSDKESSVYITLLELGPSSVTEISKRSNLNRTTGYDILSRLIQKGLVIQSAVRSKKVFVAEPPDRLVRFTERNVGRWEQRTSFARQVVPELSHLYRTTDSRPVIRYFEGVDGLKAIYEDSLLTKDTIRSYTEVDKLREIMGDYARNYFRRRAKKRIFIRAIIKLSDYGLQIKREQKQFYREVLLVPAEKFNFSLERYIYGNKVAYMSFHDRFGVILESKNIADSEKYVFELAWQSAKKYDAEIEKKLRG